MFHFFHHFHSNVVAQSRWEASVGSIAFADNAVLLEECQNVLTKVNYRKAYELVLKVSLAKTKIHSFGDLLDNAAESMHACREVTEISESSTYLSGTVHYWCVLPESHSMKWTNSRCCEFIQHKLLVLSISRIRKIRICKWLVLPVLLNCCEAWTRVHWREDSMSLIPIALEESRDFSGMKLD